VDVSRIGGRLLVASSALLVIAAFVAATGGSVALGAGDAVGAGTLASLGAIGLAAIGAGVLAISPGNGLRGRLIRAGLALVAIGLFGIVGSTIISATLSYDPLESVPSVALLLIGGVGLLLGVPLTVVALLRLPGQPRRVGLLFVGGLGAAVTGGIVSGASSAGGATGTLGTLGIAIAVLGAAMIVASIAGLGLLAMSAPERAPVIAR
jgi:hypothetical protein